MPQTPDSSASGQAQSPAHSPSASLIDTPSQGRQINVPAPAPATTWDPRALLQPKSRFNDAHRPTQNGALDSAVASPASRGNTPGLTNGNPLVFQFASNDATPAYTGTTTSATSSPGSEQQIYSHRGAGELIERMNHVQPRSTIPQPKKRKLEETDPNKDSDSVQVRNGSGLLGEYVKDKREEGNAGGSTTSTTVDLTSGKVLSSLSIVGLLTLLEGNDDDVVMIQDPKEEEVCYGMIKTSLNCSLAPSPKPGAQSVFGPSYNPIIKIILKRQLGERSLIVQAYDHTRVIIGKVHADAARALAPMMDANVRLRTEARIPSQPKKPDEVPGQPISRTYTLDVVLYGPMKFAKHIGLHLTKFELRLIVPAMVQKGIKVHNPHLPDNRPPAPRAYPTDSSGAFISSASRTVEEIRSEVLGVFDSLTRTEDLPEMEADNRITTDLLKHQKQGLFFMTEREKPRGQQATDGGMVSFWKTKMSASREIVYSNVITGHNQRQPPPETRGGILADMMGLGKTLSILALVSSSVEDAQAWANSEPKQPVALDPKSTKQGSGPPQQAFGLTPVSSNIKATLLVCPLSTITNWEEQIKQHLVPESISYHIYHGANRIKDPERLANFDLIITTYGSVSNELSSRRKGKNGLYPLEQLGFFRIVLDEAHMIREQNTLQFKAIIRLHAQRRWAVTGTPVQNRLDDLAALLAFIRLHPFEDRGKFTRHIVEPFKACDPEIVPKLRILVDTITLRRLKDKIDLPPREDLVVKLDFSQEERSVYEMFAKNAQDRVKVLAGVDMGKSLGGSSYIHILKAILRLRLLCAHGKDLLNEDDLSTLQGMSADMAINLDDSDDEKPALSSRKALEIFGLMVDTNQAECKGCNKTLGAHEGANIEAENQDDLLGYMTPCFHVLCQSCVEDFKDRARISLDPDTNSTTCSICHNIVKFEFVELRQRDVDAEHEGPAKSKTKSGSTKNMDKYTGPHTKTKALVEDLLATKAMSEANPNEPPYKSVVFSGWTSHLDLIEVAFRAAGITFTRLDGSMTRIARTHAMDRFREDSNVQVILVSIMAGGLGLNLTAGNSVYVMEPQYNPAAEAQAIDRVHRLGQERPVKTVRYIMRNSFEEKMIELQEKKKKLANLSMDAKALDKTDAAKQKLMDLRSLFK